eukprot:6740275-Prorocentrum_lima.AAC.1
MSGWAHNLVPHASPHQTHLGAGVSSDPRTVGSWQWWCSHPHRSVSTCMGQTRGRENALSVWRSDSG